MRTYVHNEPTCIVHTYSTSVVLFIQYIVYVCTVDNSKMYNVNVILLSTVYCMYISSRSGSLVCKRLGFEDYKFQFGATYFEQ